MGEIEDDVEGEADFNGAEVRREVSAVDPHGVHDELAHLARELGKLIERKFLEVERRVYGG